MKNTIPMAVSQADVPPEEVPAWVNREARPLLKALRTSMNDDYWGVFETTTVATGVAAAIWTSDAVPTNAVWLVEVRVVGFKTGGASQRAAYIRRATVYNNAGTVGQQGVTSAEYTEESAGACNCTLAVSGQTVVCSVTDDGTNTFEWLASVHVVRSREE
ncbi:MAG: hypothetical protein M3Q61_05515 [Chloroflexota bacterium]|nr:hypothetical protein [Chloroflexota bacterium]